jgi:hypothetical protein
MKWKLAGWFFAVLMLLCCLVLGSWPPVLAETRPAGIKVTIAGSKPGPGVVVRSELTNVGQDAEINGTWTYVIDGVGKQTVSTCQGISCEAVFNQHLFTVGKKYVAKVTFDAAGPGDVPKHAEAEQPFAAPPPYGQRQSYPIRCSVAYDLAAERFYLYARLDVPTGLNVEGSWTYVDLVTKEAFRYAADRDVAFAKIGNQPGRVKSTVQFDGIIGPGHYLLQASCPFTREGIKAAVSPDNDAIRVTGRLLYGNSAKGDWLFTLVDSKGKPAASALVSRQSTPEVSYVFHDLAPGQYKALIRFAGTVDGKKRILKDSLGFQAGQSPSPNPEPDDPGMTEPDDTVTPPAASPVSPDPFFNAQVRLLIALAVAIVVGVVVWVWVYKKL